MKLTCVILFCMLILIHTLEPYFIHGFEIHKKHIHIDRAKIVGRARGLMETVGTWISGKMLQGDDSESQISLVRQAPAPGSIQPCSKAGNTPHIF